MTAWRTAEVHQADTDRDTRGKDHGTGSQPVTEAAIREPLAAEVSPRPRLFFPGAIKQLFRQVKAALTPEAQAPEPKTRARRKGGEDTGRAFRMTATKIMRRASRVPADVYAKATAYLFDTLDWLNQWNHHDDAFTEDVTPAPRDHLYPHL
jgi:hypothetical protein